MRAREPNLSGQIESCGVNIGFDVFGDGAPTFLLMPTWTILHARFWKMQVPYLAGRYRVINFTIPPN